MQGVSTRLQAPVSLLDLIPVSNHIDQPSLGGEMAESKTPFKTNLDQKLGPFKKRRRVTGTPLTKPVKRAAKVDPAKEKSNRFRWILKWILILPLSIYALVWLWLIVFDLFNF
jgi:hypothetical protein